MRALAKTLPAVAFVAALSCTDESDRRARGQCGDVELLVAASDYSSTLLCAAPGCADERTIGLGTDPYLVTSESRAFFLARDLDVVYELDPRCGTAIRSFSLKELARPDGPANANDAAVAPDGTVILPLYGSGRLAFVKDGKVDLASTVDLSSFDPDGNPQANAARVVPVGGVPKLFVSLERLDDRDLLRSKQPSWMLRLDVATRAVEATIELAGRNPFNAMAELDGALFLSEPGSFDLADEELAGIERFDTATSTTQLLVRERDLGGSVAEVAVTAGCGVAIVMGPVPNVHPTTLVSFDPTTGRILAPISAPVLGPTGGYDLQGLAWRGSTLYVGDRRPGPRGFTVHVFERADGCTLTKSARTIDLPERPVALRAALP